MASPTNSISTYDLTGIREDLSDTIYNIDPDETPLLSALPKTTASNTFHEWQTDTLRASAVNAHVEGDDVTADSRTATTRLGNYCQIFLNAISTTGTESSVTKAGRATEMAYQSMKTMKEHKLDIEKALFSNTARAAGSGSTPRYMAGMGAWVATNQTNVGGGGAAPTGDGTDARTDGSQTAFTQADFDSLMQSIWTEGGRSKSKKVYLSPFQMDLALDFTGNNNQRASVTAGKVSNTMDVYVTPWGTIDWIPSLENRSRDVWVIDPKMWAVATLRGTKSEALAKTGDSEKRMMRTELTLVSKNEKANGIVADCTTS